MSDNITQFPEQPKASKQSELLIGPFEVWKVMVDGRVIPQLTGVREGQDHTMLVLDSRFGITVPNDLAYGVAAMIANALAVGRGYPWFGADTRGPAIRTQGHGNRLA